MIGSSLTEIDYLIESLDYQLGERYDQSINNLKRVLVAPPIDWLVIKRRKRIDPFI